MKVYSHRSKVSFVWGVVVGAALFGLLGIAAHAGDLPMIHGSLPVEDTVSADVFEATSAVKINGSVIGNVSGGLWSEDGSTDDIYYDLGRVGINSGNSIASVADILNSSLVVGNIINDFGQNVGVIGSATAGLQMFIVPDLSNYARAAIQCVTIAGESHLLIRFINAYAEPETIFDATDMITIPVDILLSATSTIPNITGDTTITGGLDVSGSATVGELISGTQTVTGDVDITGDLIVTGDETLSGDLGVSGSIATSGTFYSAGSISLGTSNFTPTIFADEMTLYAADGNASGITLMSTNTSITAHIDAVTHPTITSRNAFSFGPESAADSTDQSRWIFKSDGLIGLYIYQDHIEFNASRDFNPYIIMEQSENIKPATAGSPGIPGTMFFASGYIYYCTAGSSWGRVQLSAW